MAGNFINSALESKIFDSKDFDSKVLSKESDVARIVSFVNPFSYRLIANNEQLIYEIDYWFVDGTALCHLTNLRRKSKISRASFDLSSVGKNFLNCASENAYKVAFIGGAETEIDSACENLKILFPDLNIVYKHHGFIKDNFDSIYTQINKSDAYYVVVGMGTPMQEEFAIGCKKHCPKLSLILTCGGFLTQTAIKPDYYHPLIKKLGLRWLQRAYLHKHVRKRLINDYPSFIIRYLLNR
ncbi:WecB/TagA/CpsF family glycosyltransferase [Colwellia sp. MB02u-18]|uniref:WecB/TagA/CpsF family glycosyltransferase n=1 Tax=unclassified Colwellia TaxID=196834 RepID=UPI0015F51EB9|nr:MULTISPECIES: WecB/TagA/CpsF family glycosyltransferase [unclassified Colwellia]MBA6224520.1 WecB/TagA/CpsF family glycosyltransferase [Colwellia sp. MB3u-45]MBA6267610.1 WecB/TagA/CpsF family glycosyltransferase [Colwellia sp. MB3u-43]MBA6322214.1 WecB/TagA/CpsF family glycosyltransferase [Colwellia sp. MB02u-19]MBA6326198.1 WecB/TagA/CpsF family glycosyltransferase [Colwellia sp. MB02u-18]MBA6331657.1 WecB/TagA/CpsF family glycosyltransferase [Colwellia sp. MB02u-12]